MKSLILSSLLCASLASPALAFKPIERDAIANVNPEYMYMLQLEYRFAKYGVGETYGKQWELLYARMLCKRIRRRGMDYLLNRLPEPQYRSKYHIRQAIRIRLAHNNLCPVEYNGSDLP